MQQKFIHLSNADNSRGLGCESTDRIWSTKIAAVIVLASVASFGSTILHVLREAELCYLLYIHIIFIQEGINNLKLKELVI